MSDSAPSNTSLATIPLTGSSGTASGSMSVGESCEVSVPTDLTVTSDSTPQIDVPRHHRRTGAAATTTTAAAAAERTELLRNIEILKLQVTARNEQLASAAAQQQAAVARVCEQKDAIIASAMADVQRLEETLATTELETGEVRARAARELASLTTRCAQLQANMNKLAILERDARASLLQLHLQEDEYEELVSRPEHELSLGQYASVRLYEQLQPLRASVTDLQSVRSRLQLQLQSTEQQLHSAEAATATLRRQERESASDIVDLKSQINRLKAQVKHTDFRVQNYDRVKHERDNFEEDLISLQKKHDSLTLELESLKKEHSMLTENLESTKIQNRRLENESASARQELNEFQRRSAKASSECDSVSAHLRAEREKNKELHEKCVSLNAEVSLLKVNLRDSEQENLQLKERVQDTVLVRSELERRLEDVTARCQSLATELEKCNLKCNKTKDQYELEINELRSEVLNATRLEKKASEQCSAQSSEIFKLKSELSQLKLERERQEAVLRRNLEEASASLQPYKDLEKEYEESLRALDASATNSAKLFPGLCLKGNKVIEQTVKLSSQVLKLERENTEAKRTIQQLTEALEKLGSSLYSFKCAVSNMTEPEKSLHEKIISQEDQISSLHNALKSMESQLNRNMALNKKLKMLAESLDVCTSRTDELKKIKNDVNAVRDIIIKALNLDGSPSQRRINVLPSAISITRNVPNGQH